MLWDGDLDASITDRVFLYAIQELDDMRESSTFDPPGLTPGGREFTVRVVRNDIIDHENFQTIVANEHLRALLRVFLIANIRVAEHRQKLRAEHETWLLGRLWQRKRIVSLEAELKDLEAARDEAFNKYELLRRLTDWDNPWLQRPKA